MKGVAKKKKKDYDSNYSVIQNDINIPVGTSTVTNNTFLRLQVTS